MNAGEVVAQWAPLVMLVLLVVALVRKRKQINASRAEAAAAAEGGSAGARADVGGIHLHVHVGNTMGAERLGSGGNDDDGSHHHYVLDPATNDIDKYDGATVYECPHHFNCAGECGIYDDVMPNGVRERVLSEARSITPQNGVSRGELDDRGRDLRPRRAQRPSPWEPMR